MASDLMLDFENHFNQQHSGMNSDAGNICIDQGGEWDISLFDELDDMVDADELLRAMEDVTNVGEVSNLDLDLDLDMGFPLWNSDTCGDTSSSCTDADMTVDSLSPNPTLSSVSSPGSAEALSPYSLSDEPLPFPSKLSPASCGSSDVPLGRKPQRRSIQASRAKSSQPLKRPVQLTPKVSIQPKPVITAVPIPPSKTIVIQPLQALLPVVKPPPVTIQPVPPTGHPVIFPQPAHVVQLRSPQMLPSPHILSLPDRVVTMPTLSQDRHHPAVTMAYSAITQPMMAVNRNPVADRDTNVVRRQERMIKNRESASLSRKKKKEHLLTLEARLKVALSENEKLMSENGSLKKQLEGLMTENNVLKGTAPKRRTVCLLVVLVLVMLNVGPMSLFDGNSSSKTSAGTTHSGRHLLDFSPNTENLIGPETLETAVYQGADRVERFTSEEKALMVVKEPLFLGSQPPCQPPINRTKSINMAHELRGWVHRHEVERTKSRRMTNSQHKTKTISKPPDKKAEVAQIVSVQYSDMSEKSPGRELQVYYAPHRSHYDFFEEIHRRGDTFYVVSFHRLLLDWCSRDELESQLSLCLNFLVELTSAMCQEIQNAYRYQTNADHLLLPATNHNRGSRPKMSVVLPAMNINDSVIKDKEHEVMMQIDCEVMDTRILHIKSSSIPPFLRVNHTDSFYHSSPTNGRATPPVGVLTDSA